MADLKRMTQRESGAKTGQETGAGASQDENNRGEEFGASEPATRGTNRDADRSGNSKNQGHGHPREERGRND